MSLQNTSNWFRHFFHVVSNIRPLVWICSYVCLMPVFALIYWWLPDSQFRIPDNAGTDFGSWLYYSIVTITTLGFGDYTPAHGWAQAVTAVEVMCGLIILGLFLNAVGSMKSEIDVESELEKQRRVHYAMEKDKLLKSVPAVLHNINKFLAYCYAVTTPESKRTGIDAEYNPDFSFNDMCDLFKPTGLPFDKTRLPAVERLMKCSSQTSLSLDSLETRVDLTLWPELLENCFTFVANWQMFSSFDVLSERAIALLPKGESGSEEVAESKIASSIASWKDGTDFSEHSGMREIGELYHFIKENAAVARQLEAAITKVANS